MNWIGGYGPNSPNIMIIGDCPTHLDSEKPFTKTFELDSLLRDAGIHKSNCWLTTVSKYEVPPNFGKKRTPFNIRATEAGINIEEQVANLQTEINDVKPNVILGLGKSVLWALTGKTSIGSYRGSILLGMGRKFIPTYNPAHLSWQAEDVEFIGYWNRQVIRFDMMRALEESHDPKLNLPMRTLEICKSAVQLRRFIDQYQDYLDLSVDIEAHGTCLPVCIGLAFTKNHGLCVPLWNRDGISKIPDKEMVSIHIMLAELLASKAIIGQNFNYDRDKIKRIGFIIKWLKSDIMLKCHAINAEHPKSLAFNTSIYTREPFYKDEGMYEGSLEDLFMGCARDACVTKEIDEVTEPYLKELEQDKYYYNFMMRWPAFYLEIENTGFKIDPDRRDFLIRKYVTWEEENSYKLFKIVGTPLNVMSPKQVGLLLYDVWKLPRQKGTSEEDITKLLNMVSCEKVFKKNPEIKTGLELILETRRVRKTVGTYLMALPDFDGRMRTTCFPCLDTGRSKNGQQEPPIRPKVDIVGKGLKKDMKDLGMAFQTMTKHGDIGEDVRSMFIAG